VVKRTVWILLALLTCSPLRAHAGPPYDTDDPDPTEYRNYEIYSGFQTHVDSGAETTEEPFLEVNYGLMPNVQFSIHTAEDHDGVDGSFGDGFSDFEMGLKVRFIQETAHAPQIAFYPQLTFATGDPTEGVGAGHGTLLLPLWAQKTIGKVTVFGGGGFTFDQDATGSGAWQAGLAATYPVTSVDTIGMEFTRVTPHAGYQQADVGFGFQHALGGLHGLLLSVGRSFDRQPHYRAYLAYGWFLGPSDKK
jgi:hypothetical protein